jgi:hypothetical protein
MLKRTQVAAIKKKAGSKGPTKGKTARIIGALVSHKKGSKEKILR